MLDVNFIRKNDGLLLRRLPPGKFDPPTFSDEAVIERQKMATSETGQHQIWDGYAAVEGYRQGLRTSEKVSTKTKFGRLYTWLVRLTQAQAVIEFGTAFGVSGMYWLAGLKDTGGRLYTFEPNAKWAAIADQNLRTIHDEFSLVVGTFEDNASHVLSPGVAQIGFVDAIHTSEFVFRQFEILLPYMSTGAIIVFDDIAFSDDMRACWRHLARAPGVATSVSMGRVGLVELA